MPGRLGAEGGMAWEGWGHGGGADRGRVGGRETSAKRPGRAQRGRGRAVETNAGIEERAR